MWRSLFRNVFVDLRIFLKVLIFILEEVPHISQRFFGDIIHIKHKVLLVPLNLPDIKLVSEQGAFDNLEILFANLRKAVLLQKLIKELLKGLLLFSFRSKLIRIIVSDKSCLQPVLIQIILISAVFLLDEAFEFT